MRKAFSVDTKIYLYFLIQAMDAIKLFTKVNKDSGLNFFHVPPHPYLPTNRRRQSLFAAKNAFVASDLIWQRQSYHGPQLFQMRGGYGRLKLLHHHYSNQGLNVLRESTEGLFSSKGLNGVGVDVGKVNFRKNFSSTPISSKTNFATARPTPDSPAELRCPEGESFTTTPDHAGIIAGSPCDTSENGDVFMSPSSTFSESTVMDTSDTGYFHQQIGPNNGSRSKNDRYKNRVFVGNLSYRVTQTELKNLFSNYGRIVDIAIINDRFGLSKGYGLITFEATTDVRNLIECHRDQLILDGRKLRLQLAEERTVDEKRYEAREKFVP